MTICYFGNYDPTYSRNRVLIKGLKENGIKVLECRSSKPRVKKYWELFKKHKKIKNKYDLLIVGYAGYSRSNVVLAKIISKKPIIWDAFYSLYDTKVNDRKKVSKKHPRAKYYWFLDWLACKLANKILLDTNEHIKYFVKTFKIKRRKFIKVLVGTDDSVFYPRPTTKKNKNKKFLIHFHAKFIPLQGAKYIVRAVKNLENYRDITFNFIGDKGQTYSGVRELVEKLKVKNIRFLKSVPYKELPDYITRADVCLGIFGDTQKTQRVIPNKVYEAIAMEKPVITADTPAARELFTDRKNILFCRAADPEDLAKKILELKNNKDLREKIAKGGYKVFKNYATPKIVVRNLLNKLQI